MRGDLSEGIVTIRIEEGNQRAISLNQKSQFGKLSEDSLELSIIEACYLMESGRLDIYKDDEKCDLEYILGLIKEQEIYGRYLVYRDLKNRGYIIKTGFKYGSEFRLYERGTGPGHAHSDFLVKVLYENNEVNVLDFASYVRVSHGVNKKLLLAVVEYLQRNYIMPHIFQSNNDNVLYI